MDFEMSAVVRIFRGILTKKWSKIYNRLLVINYDAKYVEVIRVVVMLYSEGENTFVSKKSNTNMVMGVNKFMAEKRY